MRLQNRTRRIVPVALMFMLANLGTIALAAGPGVHGRVYALDEQGKSAGVVAGATIQFKNEAGAVVAETTSATNGYYRLDLAPGRYRYTIEAEGFKVEDQGRGIALSLTDGYAVHDFSLTRGKRDPAQQRPEALPSAGRLTGRVLEKTADGRTVGIPRATIALRRAGADRHVSTVGTGHAADGSYAAPLEVGQWRASVSAKGFETLVDPNPIPIREDEVTTRDFVLSRVRPDAGPGQGIRGIISVFDDQGRPRSASDVELRFLSTPARPIGPSAVAANGRYARDLPAGRYVVTASAEGYSPVRSRPTFVFAGRYANVNLTLRPAGEPTDQPQRLVFTANVVERLRGQTRPLPGASLLLRKAGQPLDASQRDTTGSEGSVRLTVDSPGTYVALARLEGYKPTGVRVEIRSGGPNHLDIVMERVGTVPPTPTPQPPAQGRVTVSGYVVFKDPQSRTGYSGIPRTELLWRPAAAPETRVAQQVISGRIGAYSLDLPEGIYQVEVNPPSGFGGTSQRVLVRRGMKPQYFILTPGRPTVPPEPQPPAELRLTLRVFDAPARPQLLRPQPRPIPGADVLVTQRRRRIASGRTDNAGRYSVPLEAGTYDVTVTQQGYERTQLSVTLSSRSVSRDVTLRRSSPPRTRVERSVTLEVSEIIGKPAKPGAQPPTRPIAAAGVVVTQDRRRIAAGSTGKDGIYRLRLRPGTYQVEVTHRGYRTVRQSLTVAARDVRQSLTMIPARSLRSLPRNRLDLKQPQLRRGTENGSVDPQENEAAR